MPTGESQVTYADDSVFLVHLLHFLLFLPESHRKFQYLHQCAQILKRTLELMM